MKYPNPASYNKKVNKKLDKTLGYEYFIDKEHPLASKGGKVYLHRHAYSVKVGKWVDKSYLVHHIDEDKKNNNSENLEAVSPSKHGRKHLKNGFKNRKVRVCLYCGLKFITLDDDFCSLSCSSSYRFKGGLARTIQKEYLQELVWSIPSTEVAKVIGCSDTMVWKICLKLGIDKPPRGYWAKLRSNKT